ncbi:MAG: hypothetical protein ACREBR_04560 [bacterium]
MYGNHRYGRRDKDAVPPVTPAAIPTFLCPRCNKAKSTGNPFVELTVLDKGELLLYNKICEDCSKALQEWMKGK